MTKGNLDCVGFIGLGNMGRPMAARLLEHGSSLFVYDVIKSSADDLLEKGVTWIENPADLAAHCELICTSLPGPKEAEEVYLGKEGVVGTVKSGTTCVDFTTNAPMLIRKIHSALADKGADLLDVPVSGGVEGARQGTLTMLVGGSETSFRKVRSVLEVLGSKVLHVGGTGTACICKVLHNCAVFSANLATVECLTTGVKAGVDAQTLIEVFQQSGIGKNLDLNVALPKSLFSGNFEARFAMATAQKDMRLAIDLADEYDVSMKLASACQEDMEEAVRRGWGKQDNAVFLTLQEDRAGVKVRVS